MLESSLDPHIAASSSHSGARIVNLCTPAPRICGSAPPSPTTPPPNLLQPGSEVSSCVSHKLAPEKQLEERILFLVQPQAGRHCPSFPHSPSMKTLVSGWGPGVD